MANDLFSALKTYLSKVSSGDKTPQELASALNNWARESGEAIKMKIEEEVEKSVKRMGFAKKSDLEQLEREVVELRKLIDAKFPGKTKQSNEKTPEKKGAKKITKKNAPAKKGTK